MNELFILAWNSERQHQLEEAKGKPRAGKSLRLKINGGGGGRLMKIIGEFWFSVKIREKKAIRFLEMDRKTKILDKIPYISRGLESSVDCARVKAGLLLCVSVHCFSGGAVCCW